MIVVTSLRHDSRLLRLVGRIRIVFVEAFERVRAIGLRLFFAGGAELLVLELANLAAEFFVEEFELVDALECALVASCPVSDLLPEVEVLALERRDLRAETVDHEQRVIAVGAGRWALRYPREEP